jgi:hypothetical protein
MAEDPILIMSLNICNPFATQVPSLDPAHRAGVCLVDEVAACATSISARIR